jgi:membrane protease YdiL (CAAX protease family)
LRRNQTIIELIPLTVGAVLILVWTLTLLQASLAQCVVNGFYAVIVLALLFCFYYILEKWLSHIIMSKRNIGQQKETVTNTLRINPLKSKDIVPSIKAIFLGFCTQYILGFIYTWFNVAKPDHTDLSNLPISLLIISVVFVAPIIEEITFRGFIHRCFESNPETSRIWIYIIPSFIFAILHVRYPFVLRLYHFILGLILVKLRETTHSLTPPIVVHASINAISLMVITSQTS